MTDPAEELEGTTLPDGWIVGRRVSPRPGGTGGTFSIGYLVRHSDGREGFLKGMDFSRAFARADMPDEIKRIAAAYTFERDICLKCQESGITRIVHALAHGIQPHPLGRHLSVLYLIFERADGDVRAILDLQPAFDLVFALRTLHGIAAALQQLHAAQMAHQDVKPSNVLVFAAEQKAKLGDLGRAWSKDMPAPHDAYPIAGALSYAPLELAMGLPLDEKHKRFGVDLYLLGSLTVFFFSRVHINALITKHLDPSFRVSATSYTYAEALPYFQAAFADALLEFGLQVPPSMRDQLTTIVSQLCEPDHLKRGNPGYTGINRFRLVRYVSLFDALRRQAELELCTGTAHATHPRSSTPGRPPLATI
jgi:eukaryotic-like serine/threonine-protein kinase